MDLEPWYSARCLFLHGGLPHEDAEAVYEERIILVRADSFEEAIRKAQEEARRYTEVGCEFLGHVDVYHLFDEAVVDGSELYSLMRTSRLDPAEYVARFLESGTERSGEI